MERSRTTNHQSAPCPCSMLSTARSPRTTAPPLSECSSIAERGAILSDTPHLAQSTSLLTTAGDASASDSRASRGRSDRGHRHPVAKKKKEMRSGTGEIGDRVRAYSPLTTESPTTHYCTVQHHVLIDPYAERMPRADCSSNTIRDSISRVAPSYSPRSWWSGVAFVRRACRPEPALAL